MTYTEQAEQFTQGLLACGLQPQDFRVFKTSEGRASVILNLPLEQQIALAERMGERFHVGINYDGRTPTGLTVRLEGQEPSDRVGLAIVFDWKKGVHLTQIRVHDRCDRCRQHLKLGELLLFNYNGIEVLLCFPCCKPVITALMALPLESRTSRLQALQERWAEVAE